MADDTIDCTKQVPDSIRSLARSRIDKWNSKHKAPFAGTDRKGHANISPKYRNLYETVNNEQSEFWYLQTIRKRDKEKAMRRIKYVNSLQSMGYCLDDAEAFIRRYPYIVDHEAENVDDEVRIEMLLLANAEEPEVKRIVKTNYSF